MAPFGGNWASSPMTKLVACGLRLWNSKQVEIRKVLFGMSLMLLGCAKPPPQACQPPRAYWQKPHNFVGLMPMMNDVSLTRDGSTYWNGVRISREQLSRYLKTSHKMNPEPNIFLQTEMGVPCRTLESLRDQIDETLECKKRFSRCAEGIKSVWRNLPTPPGAVIS